MSFKKEGVEIVGWHRVNGIRRCSRCAHTIGKGGRYWGDRREPLRVLCYGCRTNVLMRPVTANAH